MPRDSICFYVWACGNICCVAAIVKDSGFLSLGVLWMLCFCLYSDACSCRCSCKGSMSVCHADVVCLCIVCILWQFSILYSA